MRTKLAVTATDNTIDLATLATVSGGTAVDRHQANPPPYNPARGEAGLGVLPFPRPFPLPNPFPRPFPRPFPNPLPDPFPRPDPVLINKGAQ